MELSNYLDSVREQVAHASALADEQTQQVAQKLGASLDSALRLSLIQALSDAAAEISSELAPTSVELRMAGADPEFVVHQVAPTPAADDYDDSDDEEFSDGDEDFVTSEYAEEDEPQARFSLRIPASVKKRIDEVAAEEQISTNAWITRAVLNHLRRCEQRQERRQNRAEGRAARGERRDRRRGRGRGGRGGWGGGPGWGPGPFGPGGPGQFGPGRPGGPWNEGQGGPWNQGQGGPWGPGHGHGGGWTGRQGFRGWV